jgi:hypothetical protein
MDPERFRFGEDVLRSAASRTRRRLLTALAVVAAATAGLWAAVLRPRDARPSTLAFALVLLVFLGFLSLRRRLARLHARWSSFEIRVEKDAVVRAGGGFPPLRIARSEIAAVEEGRDRLVVRDRSGRALLVPREVEGYERLRALLKH